jgi:Zn ribbon nucleic-acid-binding protein
MIVVKCPNCNKETKVMAVYDENIEEQIRCFHCNFKASKFNFEFIRQYKGEIELRMKEKKPKVKGLIKITTEFLSSFLKIENILSIDTNQEDGTVRIIHNDRSLGATEVVEGGLLPCYRTQQEHFVEACIDRLEHFGYEVKLKEKKDE